MDARYAASAAALGQIALISAIDERLETASLARIFHSMTRPAGENARA